MNAQVPVFEAVEWREPIPTGSRPQVFRLSDGRFAIVKFPENPQGELVLANEFLCCQLAETLKLPVNRAVLVSIDERLLRLPRQNSQIPNNFSAGIRCGMIRFEKAEGAQSSDILTHCSNMAELHSIGVFEQLVHRQDGRQLLMYPTNGEKDKQFVAYDYGFAFGGTPTWSVATLETLAPPVLPSNNPFTNQPYQDGTDLETIINELSDLTSQQLNETLMNLHPPRWGLTLIDVQALIPVLEGRAKSLVKQFNQRYRPLLEVSNVHN